MNDVLDYVLDKLEEERDIITENLGDGQVVDYAEYKYRCGEIRGLLLAASIIQNLKTQMEQNDD
jgi:hypothetical protein